jgi:hypothetical protein
MGLIDLFWNLSQDDALSSLEEAVVEASGRDAAIIQRLQQENRELQIRVGVLIRLLIERGVFKADDYAALVNEAKTRLSPH